MLLPPQNNPWTSFSPCRDASASAEQSLNERFSLQRCFCLRRIISGWVFLFAEMLLQTLFVSDQITHIYPNRFVQYPTGLLGVWFCRIQSLTDKVSLVWQSRVRFRTVPFFYSHCCSRSLFKSATSMFSIQRSLFCIQRQQSFLSQTFLSLSSISAFHPQALLSLNFTGTFLPQAFLSSGFASSFLLRTFLKFSD